MKAYSITDIGMVREMNQDFVYSSEGVIGSLHNLFMVADGMGGHKAGDYASRCCVEKVVQAVRNGSGRSPIAILEQAIDNANQVIYQEAQKNDSLKGMGTTLVVATACGKELYIANIGDSRAYIIGDTITQITEDHSWVEVMVQSGDIERKDAKSHPRKNVITRAIGAANNVHADFFEITIEEGQILLLCTDGLINMVEDEEMYTILKREQDLEKAAKELVRVANQNGGRDNIGIVLVRF